MSIFSRFFKKDVSLPSPSPVVEDALTFNRRVAVFWEWFASVSERFLKEIDGGNCGDLVSEVKDKTHALLPGFAWEFGPAENGVGGHSFTLSGEGVLLKQILALHAIARAPTLSGWTFYPSRQPSGDPGRFTIQMGDLKFQPLEFWITPEIDEEHEVVDITVWHPLFDKIPENTRGTALFLLLDQIFGEFGTGQWIGEIQFNDRKLAGSMPVGDLKEFVEEAIASQGWKATVPGEVWSTYNLKKPNPGARGDTIAGSVVPWNTLRDFLDDPKSVEDPFEGLEADWIYLAFPAGFLPEGEQVAAREEIAESIEKELSNKNSGRYIGGAIGRNQSYLDFLIYDGSRSLATIKAAAIRLGLPAATRVEYLASSKRHLGRVL